MQQETHRGTGQNVDNDVDHNPAEAVSAEKNRLRAVIRDRRSARTPVERELARAAIRRHVHTRLSGLAAGTVVAGYEPLTSEPGSVELLTELVTAGLRVLVPITRPDKDLDWRPYTGPGRSTEPLGPEVIAGAKVLLVPAFAVDRTGNRLGRGGGSYDRALARVTGPATVAALLFDGEVLEQVPAAAWDHPVTAAVTPTGWIELSGA